MLKVDMHGRERSMIIYETTKGQAQFWPRYFSFVVYLRGTGRKEEETRRGKRNERDDGTVE